MADRQLAEQLSRLIPILYVEPASSIVGRCREKGWRGLRAGGRLRRVSPGLARLSPEGLPGLTWRGIRRFNSLLVSWQVRYAARKLRATVGWTMEANILSPLMGKCGERTKVYWAQDDFVGMAPLLKLPIAPFANGENKLTNEADVIIAANPLVAESVTLMGRTPHLIPFGCDYNLFSSTETSEPADDVSLPRPMAIFMGHLGDRIDLQILDRLARSGVSLLIVGPLHPKTDPLHFEHILSNDNVEWIGERPFEELPRYLAHAGVGVLPYTRSKFNLGSCPLKLLEYLAAGLPVVATDLPAIRQMNTRHISVTNDPGAFVQRVSELLDNGRDAAEDADRRQFAAQHSWTHRASAFAQLLELGGRTTLTDKLSPLPSL
jgi:teichuronic acid biosynthesis glycosyltransferase TuaH